MIYIYIYIYIVSYPVEINLHYLVLISTSPPLFYCTSLHPHYSIARCSGIQRTSSALHAIALYCMVQCYALQCISLHFTGPPALRCMTHTSRYYTALLCIVQCPTMHCMLQHFTSTAPHCTVQCSGTHCAVFYSTSLHGAVLYTALSFTTVLQHCTSLHAAVLHTALYLTVRYSALHCTAFYKPSVALHSIEVWHRDLLSSK